MTKTMILKPRISEKAYAQSQKSNVYVFQVPADANKLTVADAIATQFGVTVEAVNIANIKGKVKTSYRKRGGRTQGARADVKKAYVTIKQGDTIPVFATEEDEQPKKAATKEKK
ncbi:50S ribosomal protein L23 [Patescibacteria group bacterium]|nr:MAG: 50S ribosomal protein L23 [Patescibacteria group bacterium]